jgi:hypothetical protein
VACHENKLVDFETNGNSKKTKAEATAKGLSQRKRQTVWKTQDGGSFGVLVPSHIRGLSLVPEVAKEAVTNDNDNDDDDDDDNDDDDNDDDDDDDNDDDNAKPLAPAFNGKPNFKYLVWGQDNEDGSYKQLSPEPLNYIDARKDIQNHYNITVGTNDKKTMAGVTAVHDRNRTQPQKNRKICSYQAFKCLDGKNHYLGKYDTLEEANHEVILIAMNPDSLTPTSVHGHPRKKPERKQGKNTKRKRGETTSSSSSSSSRPKKVTKKQHARNLYDAEAKIHMESLLPAVIP